MFLDLGHLITNVKSSNGWEEKLKQLIGDRSMSVIVKYCLISIIGVAGIVIYLR